MRRSVSLKWVVSKNALHIGKYKWTTRLWTWNFESV